MTPQGPDEPSVPFCNLPRWCWYLFVAVVFIALYGRAAGWGWVNWDDRDLLENNFHLGRDASALVWAWNGSVQFSHRWLPIVWTLADAFSGAQAWGFHVGTLVLGLVLCLCVLRLCEEKLALPHAILPALLFAVSPLRWETFGYAMGFVYNAVGIAATLSAVAYHRKREGLATFWAILATVTYPVAGGGLGLLAVLYRKNRYGMVCAAALIAIFAVQFVLQRHGPQGGSRWDSLSAVLVLPHYAFVLVAPISTMPIVPPVLHWGLIVGVLILLGACRYYPAQTLALALVMAPAVFAALTDYFLFSSRYALLPSILLLFITGEMWRKSALRRAGYVYLAGLLMLSAFHVGYRSPVDFEHRREAEAKVLFPAQP